MPKKIKINNHFSIEELEKLYKNSSDAVKKSHIQIILLYLSGKKTKEIIEITKYSSKWIYKIVHRYNNLGLEGLNDNRHNNSGRTTLLTAQEQEELDLILQKPPDDGGIWSGPKVSFWISKKVARKLNKARGWDYLRRLGYTLKKPRPKHKKGNKEEQDAFKKTKR